jgi:CP family cyanate transporter-like MFS transporter
MGEKVSTYRWVMVFITWLMLFTLGASWFCFTPMTLIIMTDLNMSFEHVGIIIALVPLSLVILCIPGGLFADRFGIRLTVLIGGAIMGMFGLLRSFAADFTMLAITTFLCGVGYSITYPNLPKVTGLWFPSKEYALASGVMFTGMEVGMALPLILIPAVLLPWIGSWRGVFIVVGVISLLSTGVWMALAREKPKSVFDSSGERRGVPFREALSAVLRNKHMWILMLTTLFLLAPQIGFLGFLPSMLVLRGMNETTAGLVTSMVSWFMIPSSFIIPIISDRVGLRKPFIWGTSILASFALYAAGTTMNLPLWISVIAYGFLIGGMAPIVLAMPVELIGPLYAATAGGFMLVGGYIGALIGPLLSGYLSAATGSFTLSVIMCAAFTGAEAVCSLMLKETGTRIRRL